MKKTPLIITIVLGLLFFLTPSPAMAASSGREGAAEFAYSQFRSTYKP